MTRQQYTALRPFWDAETGKYIKTGDVVPAEELRARELARNGLFELAKPEKLSSKPAGAKEGADAKPTKPASSKPADN